MARLSVQCSPLNWAHNLDSAAPNNIIFQTKFPRQHVLVSRVRWRRRASCRRAHRDAFRRRDDRPAQLIASAPSERAQLSCRRWEVIRDLVTVREAVSAALTALIASARLARCRCFASASKPSNCAGHDDQEFGSVSYLFCLNSLSQINMLTLLGLEKVKKYVTHEAQIGRSKGPWAPKHPDPALQF